MQHSGKIVKIGQNMFSKTKLMSNAGNLARLLPPVLSRPAFLSFFRTSTLSIFQE